MLHNSPIIALLTDFSDQEPFVGIMKGVISNISPLTKVVDLTHQIPPGDLLRTAVVLWQATPYFPDGTIFLVVVDPGVGTTRLPILLKTEKH
jgi:S-adenosylmethionine hydrolase